MLRGIMGIPGHDSTITKEPDETEQEEKTRMLKQFPPYGSLNGNATRDTCPTCSGTGRIPRGHEDQLVAVIPCNDVRLKPRRTKLYVCISMAVCILLCCLILFFLYPRSITLTPVSVLSVMVYFSPDRVDMEVTNLINITNENFVPVQIIEFNIQSLVTDIVVGKTKISNMTAIQSRSQKSYTTVIGLPIVDKGLKMTLNISYFSHTEQLSHNSFEYIDCGNNSTVPHPVRR